ncbi:hypothetical protein BY458DRAFT_500112 [Sporodiniella umbellata]|nr:hypothetical protein BY458DRAFT_500112 [Sporodiniella umbellata]
MATGAPTQSIAELITEFNKTTGDVPPVLIGATTTLVNRHVYVFGGRLQSNRQISNRLYILSLDTMSWKIAIPQNAPPTPRYFHSANPQNQSHIVFYGGMTVKQYQNKRASSADELVTLDDILFLDLRTLTWEYPSLDPGSLPLPRYAHITTLVKDRLIVMGGQDVENEYLSEINVFDCKKRVWCPPLSSREFHYGAYRSAAIGVTPMQLTPPFAPNMDAMVVDPFDEPTMAQSDSDITVHVYSNHSVSDAPRQLHSWKLNTRNECVDVLDQTEQMGANSTAPPLLRFPTAFMCGQHFVLAGLHLNGSTTPFFQIWALDMTSFVWTKIEPGPGLSKGSWQRGMVCERLNKFIVLGHPARAMKDDYKQRVQCFEYLAWVDIEVFGIYKPPQSSFSTVGQSLGLSMLKDPVLADLKILTCDRKYVMVNSAVLAQRWPLVRTLLQPLTSPVLEHQKRELSFPDSYIVLLAFLQFIYTDHLVTAQQHQPQILSRLLFVADLFKMARLKALATHALHQMLNMSTAAMIYESASLSNAPSLQIRALRVLINAKKMMQRQQKLQERPTSPPLPPQPSFRALPASQSEPISVLTPSSPKQDIPPSATASLASLAQGQRHPVRRESERSMMDYAAAPIAPPTPVSAKSMKFPAFLSRQPSQPVKTSIDTASIDSPNLSPQHSPTLQAYPDPKVGKTHFWRHNTISAAKKKTKTFGFSLKQ